VQQADVSLLFGRGNKAGFDIKEQRKTSKQVARHIARRTC
jgi:hypothetical protein